MRMKIRILQSLLVLFTGAGILLGSIRSLENSKMIQTVESPASMLEVAQNTDPTEEEMSSALTEPEESEPESIISEEPEPVSESEEAQVVLPSFKTCSVSGASIERDLTIYLLNEKKKRIRDVGFRVRLLVPDEAEKLKEPLAALEEINKQLKESGVEASGIQIPESQLTEAQKLLFVKEELLARYREALAMLDGMDYSDDNRNGVIAIEELPAGKYVICFVPTTSMDPTKYAVNVTVKDKIDYMVVENIEEKTEEAKPSDDSQKVHEATPVESIMKDTVEFVDSKIEVVPPVYAETTQVAFAGPTKSSEMAVATDQMIAEEETPTEHPEGDGDLPESEASEEPGEDGSKEPDASEGAEGDPAGPQEPGESDVPDNPQGTETPLPESSVVYASGMPEGKRLRQVSLAINKSASLYSVAEADSLILDVVADGVKQLTVQSSHPALSAELAKGGCKIALITASSETFTAAVTVSGTFGNGQEISVSCEVTVNGASLPLSDLQGNKLYRDREGTEATVADYRKDRVFYYITKPSYQVYYGWQNLENKRYYFDKTGKPVTGRQVILQTEYHFGTDGVLLTSGYGIDVSKWQGTINWQEASSAISFAIIRCGFRGKGYALSIDPYFEKNIKGAQANGISVGVYIYSRARNRVQAVEEASLAVSMVRNYGLTLPIYIDMEDSSQAQLTNAERNEIITAFCKTVESSGYLPGLYANKFWLSNYIDVDQLDANISIWCAQYNKECTYKGRYDIWQYSCKGSVPGIKGNVDMDISYFSQKK